MGRHKEPPRTPITVTVLPKTVDKLRGLVNRKNPQRYSRGKIIDVAVEKLK